MQTLEKHDLRDPEISKKIAVKLLDFHKIDMPGPRKAKIWERLRLVLYASILLLNVVGSFVVSLLYLLYQHLVFLFLFSIFHLNHLFVCLSF